MNLADVRTNVETMLGVRNSEFSNTETDRAVAQAVAVLSHFFPREVVKVFVYNKSVTGETFTSDHGTAVALSNKPIEYGSESVDDGSGTSYTRDTDYEMDYVNGTITTLTAGNISDSTSTTIGYDMDPHMIDISSLTEPVRIVHVDVVDSVETPVEMEGYSTWGDFMTVQTEGPRSQVRLTDNEQIRIYYHALHDEPTASVNGTYPAHLDELVLIGTSGYILLMLVAKYGHRAYEDLAQGRIALANIAPISGEIDVRLVSITTTHALAATALAAVASGIQGNDSIKTAITSALAELALANTELDKNATIINTTAINELATANTELDKSDAELLLANSASDDAKEVITDAMQQLVIAIQQIEYAEAEALRVSTSASGGPPMTAVDAELLLANLQVDISQTGAIDSKKILAGTVIDIETALAEIVRHLAGDGSTDSLSAEEYLTIGDDLINTVNVGGDAAEKNRLYANSKIAMANSYTEEAKARTQEASVLVSQLAVEMDIARGRLETAQEYSQQADRYTNAALAFVAVANQYVVNANAGLARATAYSNAAANDINISETRIAGGTAFTTNAQGYLNAAQANTDSANAFIANATAYIQAAAGRRLEMQSFLEQADSELVQVTAYVDEIAQRILQIQAHIAEAQSYHTSAASLRENTVLLSTEANDRLGAFMRALGDRAQTGNHQNMSTAQQYASYENSPAGRGIGKSY